MTLSVTPMDFGAIGDGLCDDTEAVRAAFEYCAAGGIRLDVPPLRFRLTDRIEVSDGFPILGMSRSRSEFCWDDGCLSGIKVNLGLRSGFSDIFDIEKVTLSTRSTTSSGVALSVEGLPEINGDRFTQRVTARDVSIRGAKNPNIDGWSKGVELRNITYPTVDNYTFLGRVLDMPNAVYGSVSAIDYLGFGYNPHHCGLNVDKAYISCVQKGINANDFEGVLVENSQIMGTNYGVIFTGPKEYPHASLMNTHVASSTECVKLDRIYEPFVQGCLLYTQLGPQTGTMIKISNGAKYANIIGNTFENYKADKSSNGIIVENGSRASINSNIFRRMNSNSTSNVIPGLAVWLTAGASFCSGGWNTYDSTATMVLNNGSNNNVN